jgi:DNA-binding response OmpR family regulator
MDLDKSSLRLLIVDNQDSYRMSLVRTLKRNRYSNVDDTYDCRLAESSFRNYDVLLVDTDMDPDYGPDVCRNIRGQEGGDSVVIIGMSLMFLTPGRAEDWKNAGSDDYISKRDLSPSKRGYLDGVIQKALENRR